MITDISQLDPNGTYTYADYLKWQFDQSVELIKGRLYDMSFAYRTIHRRMAVRFASELMRYFDAKPCEIFAVPLDVRLPNSGYEPGFNNKVHTVVQPDICVICDSAKIDEYGCVGPPDWIIEITSPSTHKKDFNEKFDLYEAAGVREYWIAVPKSQELYVFVLENDRYTQRDVYEQGAKAIPSLFPDLMLDLDWIFG